MTTMLDRATTPAAPDSTARLSLTPSGVRPGRLDGSWWPRSRDLLLELPALAAALDERWGRVTRITVNPAQWPVIPRRIPVTGHTVHAGWFTTEQDEHTIAVFSYAPRRLNLLVVPPETDAVDAARLMAEAARPANTMAASGLLAVETGGGTQGPESRSDFLPSAVAPSGGAGEALRRADVARSRATSWPVPA
ncbi:hypothetical protein P3T27_000133 [Kitasatospora sp. MAA19]|uniref:DUF5994 family protein n=1 Tax=Kitasatospora sp. MAA19 TaxID=3035090 RepID=UPI0024747FDB|nr:DUF5994 family protein [Kitasatospora sp. MAA19]MDH6703452.1 hypothetical protein [Kitasatospora sp. MAA19]